MEIMVGKFINNYQIDEIIDEGGMSIVYMGIHKELKRKVAIKMLNPVLSKNPQYKKRFLNEARLLSRLNHQNIITLFDYIENDSGIFLITEYVNGQTLDEYVDLVSGPMPETKAVKIIAQILDAIGYMHTKNMIHRDIKPSNIIIKPDNTIKLIDFGIAKHLQPNQALITQDGAKLGTAISIGATLFYLLTGQYPYDKSMSDFEIYNKIVNEPFPDPHTIYTGVSDKMKLIVNKATQNQPLERYQACDEFSIALLGSQQKRSKAATVSLQTKILEASEIEISKRIFGKEFWQNTVMLLAAIGFTSMIAIGLYFLTKKDERQIIDNNAYLLAADSLNALKIEKLYYGETVKIITKPEDRVVNKPWFKVRSLRNTTGYVYAENLEVEHIFRQINEIFGNSISGSLIPAKYKKMLREYYLDNRFYNDNQTNMKVFAEENDAYELNYIAFGNYDGNNITDFACIIRNNKSENRQMVIFFDSGENISVKLTENVKIRTITAGSSGGRWYLGNSASKSGDEGLPTETKKYEYLLTDGLLLFKPANNENVVYIYSPQEKMLKFYSQ
jgi:tRNA A-37 threonylcarbamoyl transferase component Bud32